MSGAHGGALVSLACESLVLHVNVCTGEEEEQERAERAEEGDNNINPT